MERMTQGWKIILTILSVIYVRLKISTIVQWSVQCVKQNKRGTIKLIRIIRILQGLIQSQQQQQQRRRRRQQQQILPSINQVVITIIISIIIMKR